MPSLSMCVGEHNDICILVAAMMLTTMSATASTRFQIMLGEPLQIAPLRLNSNFLIGVMGLAICRGRVIVLDEQQQ